MHSLIHILTGAHSFSRRYATEKRFFFFTYGTAGIFDNAFFIFLQYWKIFKTEIINIFNTRCYSGYVSVQQSIAGLWHYCSGHHEKSEIVCAYFSQLVPITCGPTREWPGKMGTIHIFIYTTSLRAGWLYKLKSVDIIHIDIIEAISLCPFARIYVMFWPRFPFLWFVVVVVVFLSSTSPIRSRAEVADNNNNNSTWTKKQRFWRSCTGHYFTLNWYCMLWPFHK